MTAERLQIMSYWETKNSYKESNPKWKAEEIWINFHDSELSENNNLIELFGVHVVVEDGREYIYFMTDPILECLDPVYFEDVPNDKQAMIMEWMLLTKGEKCGFKDCFFNYIMGMHFVYDEVCENMVYTRSCPILLFNGDKMNVQERERVDFSKELREALFFYLSGMKKKNQNKNEDCEKIKDFGFSIPKVKNNNNDNIDNQNPDEESLNFGDEECSEYESFENEIFDFENDSGSDDFDDNETRESSKNINELNESFDCSEVKPITGDSYTGKKPFRNADLPRFSSFRNDDLHRFTSLGSYKYNYSTPRIGFKSFDSFWD